MLTHGRSGQNQARASEISSTTHACFRMTATTRAGRQIRRQESTVPPHAATLSAGHDSDYKDDGNVPRRHGNRGKSADGHQLPAKSRPEQEHQ